MTAGLLSTPACVRVIIRDVAGKHSWDSAVLYGPPLCSPSSPPHTFFPHKQSSYNTDLQLHTPPGGPPKKLQVNIEDEEEGQEDRQAEDGGGQDMEVENQVFHGDGEEREQRKVDEEEKVDQRGGEVEREEEEEEKNENRLEREEEHGESVLEQLLAPPMAKRVCWEAMPAWDSLREGDDALDEMLQYLGYSSPECLQRAGTHTQ